MNALLQCKICASKELRVIGKPEQEPKLSALLDKEYQVVRCSQCGFYFLNPEIPRDHKVWGELYVEEYFIKMTPWWAQKRMEHRRDRLNRLERLAGGKIQRFLDIGCGEGYVSKDAAKRDWEVFALDLVDNRLQAYRDLNISFFQGDLMEASYPSEYFDAAYMDSVLEHVPEPIELLSEIHRVLRRGGVLYLGVPNEDALFNSAKKLLYVIIGKGQVSSRIKPFKTPYHMIGFTKTSLLKALARTQFSVLELRNLGGAHYWRRFRPLSKPFLIHLGLLPVHWLGNITGRATYLEAIVKKE